MNNLGNMPTAGLVVMIIIGLLFILAVLLLFHVYLRYKLLAGKAKGDPEKVRGFRAAVLAEYTNAYQKYGQDTNTPAIITDTVAAKLSGLLFCERFLNNAVSLFVTLGLFGTFLGLSLSVASLTELLRYSSGEDWLSVMDSVGGGLLSALSGMGVAFYTSLVGAGCSILLTILKTVFNPQAAREQMETRMELWLDTEVAPELYTEAAKNDSDLVRRMIAARELFPCFFGSGLRLEGVEALLDDHVRRDLLGTPDGLREGFRRGVLELHNSERASVLVRLHDEARAEFREKCGNFGRVRHHPALRNRQPDAFPKGTGRLLVDPDRAREDAGSRIGNAKPLEDALDRAVLAADAVEHVEDPVEPGRFELGERLTPRVEAHRVDSRRPEGREDTASAGKGNLPLA